MPEPVLFQVADAQVGSVKLAATPFQAWYEIDAWESTSVEVAEILNAKMLSWPLRICNLRIEGYARIDVSNLSLGIIPSGPFRLEAKPGGKLSGILLHEIR